MKKAVLTIFLTLVAAGVAAAQSNVSLRQGDQKKVAKGLTVHFIEVSEDSRCPVGTTCVWAGNAKVKLTLLSGKKKAQEFELNSDLKPISIEYAGYKIGFVSLTRRPTQPGRMTMVRPELVLSIKRIKR
jgi:hypothetical protein